MSTTSNIIAGVTLTSALVVGGIALSPEDAGVASDAGVADAGQQPMIGNFYLRFPDEATFRRDIRSTDFWQANVEMEDAGPDAGMVPVTVDSGTLIMADMGHAFDILGTLVVPRRDADGGIVPDGGSETLDGWHVNFSGILPDEWVQYVVEPDNPVRRMR
jgi:hypothetical protein